LLFVLSASVLPFSFKLKKATVNVKEIDPKKVVTILLNKPYQSAVGYPETAEFLSELLHIKLDVSRESIKMGNDDSAIVLQLRQRVSGKTLSKQELKEMLSKKELHNNKSLNET